MLLALNACKSCSKNQETACNHGDSAKTFSLSHLSLATRFIVLLTAIVGTINLTTGSNSSISDQETVLTEWAAELRSDFNALEKAAANPRSSTRAPNKADAAIVENEEDASEGRIDASVLVSGVAKDVSAFKIPATVQRLVELGNIFRKHHIVIVQSGVYGSDSRDPSTDLFKQAFQDQGVDPSTYTVLSEEEELLRRESSEATEGGPPSARVARARNILLDYIRTTFPSYEYQLVTDLDGTVCHDHSKDNPAHHFNHSVFRQAFQLEAGWDALSFRVKPYWDLRAFRHNVQMPFHRNGPNHHVNPIQTLDDMDRWLDTLPTDQLTAIESGFMFLSIYRLNATLGVAYNGSDDCEHVKFHSNMRKQNNARIRLLPLEYCAPGPKVEDHTL